jgi:RNA polymerase sigma-70 factor (ECF subfamily)
MPEINLEQNFLDERPRLFQMAYRLLGTVTDAEDVLQDVFVRLRTTETREATAPRAYLTRAVVRRCLDEWKSARHKREQYVGPWLPEPQSVSASDPAQRQELDESVSVAFLVVLESLTPVERAVFLLHDVFQYDFEEIATIVEKSSAACRQLAHRAREKVREKRPRFPASPEQHRRLVGRFLEACKTGELSDLQAILAEDVTVYSDGGGVTTAARVPVVGIERVTRFLLGIRSKAQHQGMRVELRACDVNGAAGIMQFIHGKLHSVMSIEGERDRIRRFFFILNPEKLATIASDQLSQGD